MRQLALLAAFASAAVPAFAQLSPSPWQIAASTPPAASTPTPTAMLGTPLPDQGGPWILGEVLFFSGGRVAADYAWRDRVRGRRGNIYTAADLREDTQALRELGVFERVTASVYAMPNTPVPPEFATVSVSSDQVRVVFDVVEKPKPDAKPRIVTPPSAVSGLILTPTAYRGAGKHNNPGMGLDINAAYFIGRLYGKNDYPDSPRKTDYIDRVGLWTLSADGKMQVQSDADWRPALAVGGQAVLVFRDAPQPTVATPAVSVKVDAKTSRVLYDGYVAASKNLRGVRLSAGVMQGNFGEIASYFSEYLTPEALRFYGRHPVGTTVFSRTMPFASALYLIKPDFPIGVEYLKFNGAHASPYMVNFKIGRFLKMNFDIAYVKYRRGYDVLGLFQFRYNHFPRN